MEGERVRGGPPPPPLRDGPSPWLRAEHQPPSPRSHRVDLGEAVARFRDYAKATGKTYKDWDAALNNWIRNERVGPRVAEPRPPSASTLEAPPDELDPRQYAAWVASRRSDAR